MRATAGQLCILALLVTLAGAVPSPAPTTAASLDRAACAMQRLSTSAKIGQILMVGVPGTLPSASVSATLRKWAVGGVILFGDNVEGTAQLRTFIRSLQHAVKLPLLVSTDQEGGEVDRVTVGLTPLASEAWYGTNANAATVYTDTRKQGAALRSLGINLNLAPVVDVLDTPYSAIGSRSYGPDPNVDATLAASAIRGYQAAGIGATAKHFLGLGSVATNADDALPIVTASKAVLEARDMLPMRAAVRADVAALMVTRVLIPAFDPGTAAYASAAIVQEIIRGELGYKGLIITDSLLSGAVQAGPGPVTAALAALHAGDDMLLFGSGASLDVPQMQQVLAAISAAVANGSVSKARLDDAVLHVLRLKNRLGLLPAC